MQKIVFSMATYPKRWNYLRKALDSIIGQTVFKSVDALYINVDDNLTDADYAAYRSLERLNEKVRVNVCPAKWKVANKLIPVYEKRKDDVIICFDDDKSYPPECAEQLIDAYGRHPGCIIAQEVNPAVFSRSGLEYLNAIDVKLEQEEFGKYLSNGCLFCPRCFDDVLFDYDQYKYVTEGNNDELWFWIASTLKGVKCVCLANTWSYEADGICFAPTATDLTNINAKREVVEGYNRRLNERFGAALAEVVSKNTVDFRVSPQTAYGALNSMHAINRLYGGFRVKLDIGKLPKSWELVFKQVASQMKWREFCVVSDRQPAVIEAGRKKCCICAIAKDEDNYIDEWIEYHLKIGFDKIFVYQNNWRYKGRYLCNEKVQFIEFDMDLPDTQGRAYNDFISRLSAGYDFAAFFDIDEFLTLKNHSNVNDFLKGYADVDAIGLNWRVFGDNGLQRVENGNYSVVSRFTRCSRGLNKHVKLIVNLNRFDRSQPVIHNFCVHYTLKSAQLDSTVNVSKTAYIHGPFNENDLDKCVGIAYLNHYRGKTKEESYARSVKNQAGIFYYNPYVKDFDKLFEEHNCNDVEDLTALRFFRGDAQQ